MTHLNFQTCSSSGVESEAKVLTIRSRALAARHATACADDAELVTCSALNGSEGNCVRLDLFAACTCSLQVVGRFY